MSDTLVKALDGEIAQLERKLAANPDYIKLAEVRRLRALYLGERQHTQIDNPPAPTGVVRRPSLVGNTSRSRTSTERQKIVDAAKDYIREFINPTKTADIFAFLERAGFHIPGEKPQNNLSAMLSNSPDFVSHGRAGWTLAENEIAVDAGHSQTTSTANVEDRLDQAVEPHSAWSVEPAPGGGT
ncbi:MAG: hypothetical protein M9924_10275 [Rhizobiaceae bacterium]|nr:hypothetical protein [Rhizobiaceae bacterium]